MTPGRLTGTGRLALAVTTRHGSVARNLKGWVRGLACVLERPQRLQHEGIGLSLVEGQQVVRQAAVVLQAGRTQIVAGGWIEQETYY